jgi:hypothetical protein
MDPSLTVWPTRTERATGLFRRVLWIVESILRGLTILGIVAGVAVCVAGGVWLLDRPPADGNEWIARLVILGALLAPPVVLLLFVAGLRDLRTLPERARALPADARVRALEARDQARRASQPRGILAAILALFRLGRLVLGTEEALSPFGAVAIVLRPAMLIAAAFAALAAVLEVPVALGFVLILALT